MSKFFKKLRREAKANPGKAAILGGLLLVAIWFWAPLIRKWTSASPDIAVAPIPAANSTSSTSPSTAAPPVAAPTPTPTVAAPDKPAAPKYTWKQLADAIEHDVRMQPFRTEPSAPSLRSPFTPVEPPVVAASSGSAADATQRVDEDTAPDELGLALSATVVGAKNQKAMINEQIYAPGAHISAADGVVFTLSVIEPRRVVLERDGKQFELSIPEPGATETGSPNR